MRKKVAEITPAFPSPWSIEERQEFFIVRDATGQQLAYLYFEDEPQRQLSTKRLSRDEAFPIAVNIATLPSVPRQILKDTPRPPNTASRGRLSASIALPPKAIFPAPLDGLY